MSLLHAMQLPNPNKPHSSVGWATALHVRGLQVKPSRSHWSSSTALSKNQPTGFYLRGTSVVNGSNNNYLLLRQYFILRSFTSKIVLTQLTFTCSKSTIETLEKGVRYVQS